MTKMLSKDIKIHSWISSETNNISSLLLSIIQAEINQETIIITVNDI